MVLRILITLFLTAGLLGCVTSTTPTETFNYILDNDPVGSQNTLATASIIAKKAGIKVLPVQVPDYLNQPNLILKLSNHQIKIANYHFWAEDLSQSIQRVLINELNNAHNDLSYTQRCVGCDELAITIDHFYPTEQGDVVLSGTYENVLKDGSRSQTRFSLTKKLEKGGFDEAVSAMRALLGELAQQIK
ncbi:MAG: putative lipoprotein YmbA [Alphaproteobacteria bacterium]|jgi:uncharacterized lipoprotein YmbA